MRLDCLVKDRLRGHRRRHFVRAVLAADRQAGQVVEHMQSRDVYHLRLVVSGYGHNAKELIPCLPWLHNLSGHVFAGNGFCLVACKRQISAVHPAHLTAAAHDYLIPVPGLSGFYDLRAVFIAPDDHTRACARLCSQPQPRIDAHRINAARHRRFGVHHHVDVRRLAYRRRRSDDVPRRKVEPSARIVHRVRHLELIQPARLLLHRALRRLQRADPQPAEISFPPGMYCDHLSLHLISISMLSTAPSHCT